MEIKGFLFDMDGTLAGELPSLHYKAFSRALQVHHLPIIPLELHDKEYNGLGTKEKLRKWRPGINEGLCSLINETKQALTEQMIQEEVKPEYETSFFIKYLSAHYPLAVVTNCLKPTTMQILINMNILQCFKAVISASDVKNKKPHPEPYLAGAAALNLRPTECIAVDDTKHGVDSAVAAGCLTWHLKSPKNLRLSRLWSVMDLLKNQQVVEL